MKMSLDLPSPWEVLAKEQVCTIDGDFTDIT